MSDFTVIRDFTCHDRLYSHERLYCHKRLHLSWETLQSWETSPVMTDFTVMRDFTAVRDCFVALVYICYTSLTCQVSQSVTQQPSAVRYYPYDDHPYHAVTCTWNLVTRVTCTCRKHILSPKPVYYTANTLASLAPSLEGLLAGSQLASLASR